METELKPVIGQLVNFATTYGLQILGAILILIFGRIVACKMLRAPDQVPGAACPA
jgi:hypothetical protein